MLPSNWGAPRPSGQRERWAVSYADLLTILLVFFAGAAAQLAARTSAPDNSQPLAESMQRLRARGIDAQLTPAGLAVNLPQAVLFDTGEDRVSEEALPLVEGLAEVLTDIPNRVRVAGYADSTPIRGGRFADNWDLAASRGLNLLRVLAAEFGIDEARLSVESFGSQAPKDSNETPNGRAANRRVEVLILN